MDPCGPLWDGGTERKRMNSASPVSQPAAWRAASIWAGRGRRRREELAVGLRDEARAVGDVCVSRSLRTRRPGFESLLCSLPAAAWPSLGVPIRVCLPRWRLSSTASNVYGVLDRY